MKAVVYCRVSSKEQIEGTSLESQESACREFAQAKKIEILKTFIEQGESAKFADRTQLLALIDFCKANRGSVNALIVWKVDRFARNVSDHFSVKATLAKHGVRIMSVTEPIDTNPEGKLMETILAGFAQFDNDIRAMRTVQGMRRKLREGIFPWGPPLGYKSSVQGNEKKTMPDVPHEPTFSILKKAFGEFATGAHTQAQMGRLMQSWGLGPAHGKPFPPQSLFQIFTNPFYAGILTDPWSGEEFQGKHVPLISRDEFVRVQRGITRRNRSIAHHKERDEFPLRGFARCDSCHQAVTGAFSRGRSNSYAYYFCAHRGCVRRGKSIPVATVHDEFASFLDKIAPRPGLMEQIEKAIAKASEDNERHHSVQRQLRRKRIGQLGAAMGELIRMRAQSLITDTEFLEQKKRLADQQSALEYRIDQGLKPARIRADLQKITAPLRDLRATWRSLAPPLRVRFGRLILPGGFLIGRIRTADLGLLFGLFRTSAEHVSSEVPLGCVSSNRSIEDLAEEIEAFRDILNGVEVPKLEPKRRFECSHRNRLRMRKLNQEVS